MPCPHFLSPDSHALQFLMPFHLVLDRAGEMQDDQEIDQIGDQFVRLAEGRVDPPR